MRLLRLLCLLPPWCVVCGCGGVTDSPEEAIAVDASADAHADTKLEASVDAWSEPDQAIDQVEEALDEADTGPACGPPPPCSWSLLSEGWGAPGGLGADALGNSVMVGIYGGDLSFGGPTISFWPADSGSPYGISGLFAASLDAQGKHRWTRHLGSSTQWGVPIAVAVAPQGNVVIAGAFEELSLGTTLVSQGGADMFVARLSSDGSDLWARTYGGPDLERVRAVSLDSAGAAVLTGEFDGTVALDTGSVTATGTSGLLLKVDAAGTLAWSRAFHASGTSPRIQPWDVATDPSDNIVVVGECTDTADFGGGPLPGGTHWWAFVAKFNADGEHLWSKAYAANGSMAGATAQSLAIDATGQLVIAGFFSGDLDFGGDVLSSGDEINLPFIMKLDADGDHVWSHAFLGTNAQAWPAVSMSASGDIWMGGSSYRTITYGGCEVIGAHPAANAGSALLAKLDSSGHPLWARSLDPAEGGSTVVHAIGDEVLVGGMFGGTTDLGCGALTSTGAALWARIGP